MSPHGMFPLQLVNQVIEELGEAHRNIHYTKSAPYRAGATEALRACALVSKKWTARSRAQLFKEVKIEARKGQPKVAPPPSILPYIKELEISYDSEPTKAASLADLLKTFTKAPIERLGITGGVLVDKRACIQECVNAHSATLQTVEFGHCSISAYNIADIVLGRHRLKALRFSYCRCERLPPPGQPLIADTLEPDSHSKAVELELSLTEGDAEEGPMDIVAMVARLPYRFIRLDIDHVAAGYGTTEATNALIKANAGVLSSLRVHIQAEDMEVVIKPKHLFSLKACSNLSELTLDMESSESCAVRDSIFILSTLDPTRSSRLGKIVLQARYVSRWFNKDGPEDVEEGEDEEKEDEEEDEDGDKGDDEEDEDDEEEEDEKVNWKGLDNILSKLAKAAMGGKRLTFILVVPQWCDNKELVPTIRKWLPKLLPCFNELGSLHVHYGRGNRCQAVDDGCLYHDKPDCLV